MVFNTEVTYKVKTGKKPPRSVDRELRAWQDETTRRLAVQPGAVRRPIRWTSERQRRAFFATDGFGRGIPTRRTGKVAEWAVFVDYDAIENMRKFLFQLQVFLASINPLKGGKLGAAPANGLLVGISNATPYMKYVEGVQQQGFHRDTGWIFAPEVIGDAVRQLDGIVEDSGIL